MNLKVFRLEVLYTMFTQLQTTFAQGDGEQNPLVEVTVNSKEENSEDFCPNYVQEFGFWAGSVV